MQIENDRYTVRIDPRNGVIVDVVDRAGGYSLIAEPRLAENFCLLLPLPENGANYILGKEQRLTRWEEIPNGILLRWDGPLAGFDIDVAMWIEFVDEAIHFRLEVANRTQYKIGEVWYPILGGMMGLGDETKRRETKALAPRQYHQWTADPYITFGSETDLGTPIPEHTFKYPQRMSMPWFEQYNPAVDRGLYFGCHDREARAKVLRLAMSPGIGRQRADGDWPTAEELNGLPAGAIMNWAFFPYTPPGETFQGPPVVLQCHAGDWREGARLYREWFTREFPPVDSWGQWLRRATAYQNTMFLLPEGNVNVTFKEMPRWAQDALDCGINTVLVSGWHVGGHDRGYPSYEPDPRLGSWEELAAGIEACHRLGMRVFFFVNIMPVDMGTEWYRRELHKYTTVDPDGCLNAVYGWGMGTLGARIGVTRAALTTANPAHDGFRAIITGCMRKLAEIGADGIHIDKLLPPLLDFNPALAAGPDRAAWEGHLQCLDEIVAACRAVNPEFCLSVEGCWDRLLAYTDVIWWAPPEPSVMKYTFPQWVPCMGITEPYDFNVVNRSVLLGHHLLIGPAHYTASMAFPPMRALAKYLGEITRLRRELFGALSRGEYLGPEPMRVEGPESGLEWSVFRDPETGQRAGVLANFGNKPVEARAAFADSAGGEVLIYRPFQPVESSAQPVEIGIPGERVVLIVEKG